MAPHLTPGAQSLQASSMQMLRAIAAAMRWARTQACRHQYSEAPRPSQTLEHKIGWGMLKMLHVHIKTPHVKQPMQAKGSAVRSPPCHKHLHKVPPM